MHYWSPGLCMLVISFAPEIGLGATIGPIDFSNDSDYSNKNPLGSASATNFSGTTGDFVELASVPEPGTLLLMSGVLALLACWRYKLRLLPCALRRR